MVFSDIAADVLIGIIGALHVYIFYLESLIWYRGAGRSFGYKPEGVPVVAGMAANQGFYNLVLAVGCFYSLWTDEFDDKVFFVTAILCCGIIGFITTGSAKILRVQCVPNTLALIALFYTQSIVDKTGLDKVCVGAVVAAAVATIAISTFVKQRLVADAAHHAKKASQ